MALLPVRSAAVAGHQIDSAVYTTPFCSISQILHFSQCAEEVPSICTASAKIGGVRVFYLRASDSIYWYGRVILRGPLNAPPSLTFLFQPSIQRGGVPSNLDTLNKFQPSIGPNSTFKTAVANLLTLVKSIF